MNLPGLPDLDLEVLEAQLNSLYQIARELHGNFWERMLARKVSSEYLEGSFGYIPDAASLDNFLPDIDTDTVEYSASQWQYGDTDYFAMKVDRAVLEGNKSLDAWVEEAYAVWQSREEEAAKYQAKVNETLRAERLAKYLKLKKEFDGAETEA